MSFAQAQRGEWSAARSVPTLTILVLVVATVMPLRIPDYAAVAPLLALAGVFHWTIYRPDLMSSLAVFACGLIFDLLSGAPLGVTALLLLIARGVILPQRRFFINRLFPFVWGGFTLLAAAAIAFLWLLGSVLEGAILDMREAALQWVLTVACFPGVSYPLMRIQRSLVPSE
jgi:rod shape-determining protein MreD